MADLISLAVNIVIQSVIIAPVLWFAGRKIAEPKDVKFTDAVWIVVLGNVISLIAGFLGAGLISSAINLVLWLLLIKHFFDTGWIKAIAISIIAVIIFVVIGFVMELVGFGLLMVL